VGVAGLGAIFEDRIGAKLAELAPQAPGGLAESVAAGGTREIPPRLADAAQQAFIAGLNDILLIGAATLLVGALAAVALVRARDFVRARGPAAVVASADPATPSVDDRRAA
jgi:hypothetical protein